jgi:FtsP/CotA-like multicopper oxidase with cupredoxin domain
MLYSIRHCAVPAGLLLVGLGIFSFLSAESVCSGADDDTTGGIFQPPSPPVDHPFTVELPRMPIKKPLSGVEDLSLKENGGFAPNGTVYPQITGNDALTTYMNSLERIVAQQQRNSGNNVQFPPKHYYMLDVKQAKHVFHSEGKYKNGSIIWGYDGIFPGPTFVSRYGEPVLVRIYNRLYDDEEANPKTPGKSIPGGFGDPRISTHLHNGHTGSESDGNPADIYPPIKPPPYLPKYPDSILAIRFRDHHYPMFRAGLDPRVPADKKTPNKNDGDIAEAWCTQWYHDHSMDFTSANVYKGLAGFHLLFDEIDSGNEKDPSKMALRLPSGEFDIPLLFQDKRFDENGQMVLKSSDPDNDPKGRLGILGDRFTVNGQIQPKLSVLCRKYRFRLLNAGPSRFYQFFLTKDDKDQDFIQIGSDQRLLEKPFQIQNGVLMSVAERADVIIDFSRHKKGDKLFFVNRLKMENSGFAPVAEYDDKGNFLKYKTLPAGKGDHVLRFEVVGDADDPSQVPESLRPNPGLPPEVQNKSSDQLKQLPNHRFYKFELSADDDTTPMWVINGRPFAPSPAGAATSPSGRTILPVGSLITPRGRIAGEQPDGEVWTLINTGGWAHPVHIHLEEFQILKRNCIDPPPNERSRKDVLRLDPLEEVQIFLRFRDFFGKYPVHCHNVVHEDHNMMLRFDVVGDY